MPARISSSSSRPGPSSRSGYRTPGPARSGRSSSRVNFAGWRRARRHIHGLSWSEDLGGMGAGYAAALGGTLHHALGSEDDPGSQIRRETPGSGGHRPSSRSGSGTSPADWTLLLTSGAHGDKLAIGFRGCHAALAHDAFDPWLAAPCDLRVAAGLPNSLAARVLRPPGLAAGSLPRPCETCSIATVPSPRSPARSIFCAATATSGRRSPTGRRRRGKSRSWW